MRLALATLAVGLAWTSEVRATEPTDQELLFSRATTAFERNKLAQALQDFETLADQGPPHPDVSYNRGLAYATRARSPSAVPGDLGRAAAAFEEARRLDPRDQEAERALDLVRAEVTRRRSKLDKKDVVVRPSLDRVVARWLSPGGWGLFAIAASTTFATGLLLRQRARGSWQVAGTVAAPLAFLLSLLLVPMALFARHLAENTRPAVVVVPETMLEDDAGKPIELPPLPEATLVELGARKNDRVEARWGAYEGWLPAGHLRPLVLPD
jgi:tetratricopeptide (TPR) repeat protein